MHLRLREIFEFLHQDKMTLSTHQHSRHVTVEYVSFLASHRLAYRISVVHSANRHARNEKSKATFVRQKKGPRTNKFSIVRTAQ